MDMFLDFLKTVGAGVISNLISPYVRKWLDKLRKKLR